MLVQRASNRQTGFQCSMCSKEAIVANTFALDSRISLIDNDRCTTEITISLFVAKERVHARARNRNRKRKRKRKKKRDDDVCVCVCVHKRRLNSIKETHTNHPHTCTHSKVENKPALASLVQPFPQCFVSAEDAGVPADDVQEDVERAQPAGLCSAAGGEIFLSLF